MSRRDQERIEALEQYIQGLAEQEQAIVLCPKCGTDKVYADDDEANKAVLESALEDHDPARSPNSRQDVEDAATRVLTNANAFCAHCEQDNWH